MKSGWESKPLGEVCEIVGGGTPPKNNPDYYGGPIPWATVRDMHSDLLTKTEFTITEAGLKSSSSHKIPRGEVVMASRVGLGKVVQLGQDTAINQDLRAVIPKSSSELDRRYLFLWLKSMAATIVDAGTGATVQGVKLPFIKSLAIPLPPLDEQKRIAAVLDEAFEGLERARANAEANLADARAVYSSFVDQAFTAPPHGWDFKRLPEISENLDSRRVPVTKSDRVTGEVPYYGASGVVDYVADHLFDDDLLLISEDGANLLARTYPIAFSVSGKSWVNNHAHVLKFESATDQAFVELYLNSISLKPYVSGMAQPKLNQRALNEIPVPYPPLETREAIVVSVTRVSEEVEMLVDSYEGQILSIEALRQSLLEQAYSGQLA